VCGECIILSFGAGKIIQIAVTLYARTGHAKNKKTKNKSLQQMAPPL